MQNASSVKLDWRLWKYIPWVGRFWELLVECRRVRKILPRLRVSCDAFQSEHDELVAASACRDLAANRFVELTVLPQSGHYAYSDADTGLLCQRLAQRLAEVESQ